MKPNVSLVAGRLRGQAGQGMVEYALVLILVSLVVVAALLTVGSQISDIFNTAVNKLKTA